MKLDGGTIQDLFHYSLSMVNDPSGAFPCDTLLARLDCANRFDELLALLEDEKEHALFDGIQRSRFQSEDDLRIAGEQLRTKVTDWAWAHGIDPRTGEKDQLAEAMATLVMVKAELGRNYKSAIRDAWMSGNYRLHGLERWDSALQRIRNNFGPTWLVNARP